MTAAEVPGRPGTARKQTQGELDRAMVIKVWEDSRWPSGVPTLDDAWLGIVQTIWWFHDPKTEVIESAAAGAPAGIIAAAEVLAAYHRDTSPKPPLHVTDGDRLVRGIWVDRADRIEEHIANALGVGRDQLPDLLDRMRAQDRWFGKQRQNLIGNAFRTLVHEVLERWGNPSISFVEEVRADDWFPGIRLPGRSKVAKMDVAAIKDERLRSTLSCKWGFRHDRISDPTNECQEYSGAAKRRQWQDYDYWLVTNELDGQRLVKAIEQTCMGGVVHMNPDLVRLAGGEIRQVVDAQDEGRFLSLPEFVRMTATW